VTYEVTERQVTVVSLPIRAVEQDAQGEAAEALYVTGPVESPNTTPNPAPRVRMPRRA